MRLICTFEKESLHLNSSTASLQSREFIITIKNRIGIDGVDGRDGRDGVDGAKGDKGDKGERGERGEQGAGVPTGGSAGHILIKQSGADYDTQWNSAPQLAVTITQTTNTNLTYAFVKADFDDVASCAANNSLPISVRIADKRSATYKIIDLSGVYSAKWNSALSQIEIADPLVARGFYLNGGAPANRGCVTFDTPKYIARGAVFNPVTGFYELNTLTDLTEGQTRYSYEASSLVGSIYQDEMCRRNPNIRTLFNVVNHSLGGYSGIKADNAYADCVNIEVINVRAGYYIVSRFIFANCVKLKSVLGELNLASATVLNNDMFTNCVMLESVLLNGVKFNVSFAQSPNINKTSIVRLLTRRVNALTTTITLTLHPTAYAWASTDSEIQALLPATATKGPVTLASA